MRPVTESDILDSFINATPQELERMTFPGLHEVVWEEREFLGWRDTRSARVGYISHWRGDQLISIVVRAAQQRMRPGIMAMCSLCHSTQPSTTVQMFSMRFAGERGDRGSTMGTYLCESLACSYVLRRGPAYLLTPSELDRRTMALTERVDRLITSVEDR